MEDILETLNEGVLISDDCQRVLFVNSCFAEMTATPADEIIGQLSSKFYTPDEYQTIQSRISRDDENHGSRFEFVLPRRGGGRTPVIISSRTFEDPNGREFAVLTFTDISDQKRAESQAREMNALLQHRQEEIDGDLALASRVQQSLVPQPLVWGSINVDTYFHAVRTIGGDFGIVSPLENEHLTLLLCDVSGHGIGSALIANRLYTEMTSHLAASQPLGDMLRHLNRFVMQSIGNSVFFFTVAAARIDRDGRRMIFAGAGHPPAMVVTPGREPRLLESRSMVLGALPDAMAMEATLDVDLNPGDRVVLYTDGLTDVFNATGDMLGVEGIQKIVRETAALPFSEMKHAILDRLNAWREGPFADDLSLIVAEIQ